MESVTLKMKEKEAMKNITISDIAAKAGVSKATVSRVLNTPDKVEEGTRKKVRQIMKEEQYIPSATARNLSKRVSSTIGVIVPEISNAFFGELFQGIEGVISKNNLSLFYSSHEDDMTRDFQALEMMRMQRVRGVLYIPAVNYPAIGKMKTIQRRLESLGCPVVCMDRDIGLHLDTIHFDDEKAMKQAVVSLAEVGHEKIAIINGNQEENILASERYNGYLAGMKAAGLKVNKGLVFQGVFKKSYSYLITRELLMRDEQPTAVITCNNSMSRGYLQAIYEAKKPHLYTHVSLDKIDMLDLLGIGHNYIRRDAYELGKKAAELLIARIAFPERTVQNVLMEAPLVRETY